MHNNKSHNVKFNKGNFYTLKHWKGLSRRVDVMSVWKKIIKLKFIITHVGMTSTLCAVRMLRSVYHVNTNNKLWYGNLLT